MIKEIEIKLKQIQDKLALLARKNSAIRKENQTLRESLQEAKAVAGNAATQAEALQHQLDAKKYAQAKMEPEERKAFEKKINSYIREIDKCIALLSV